MAAGRCTSTLTSMTFFLSVSIRRLASFAAVVVLPAPCKAGQHDDNGRLRPEGREARFAAENLDQLGMNNLDQGLTGRQALADLFTERALPNALDKCLHDRQGDVRLQQCKSHLAQRVLDVGFGQPALAGQLSCGVRKAALSDSQTSGIYGASTYFEQSPSP